MRVAVSLLAFSFCGMVAAAAEDKCPWMNAATAEGLLGGAPQVAVAPTACEFIRRESARQTSLRIEVTPVNASRARCGAGAEPLKAIGNEASACSFEVRPGWVGEQVSGRVRDQVFVVRFSMNAPATMAKALREKARGAAEAVAGILF